MFVLYKEEIGFEHQEVAMPAAPAPETLLSMEELRDRSYLDPRLPEYISSIKSLQYNLIFFLSKA